MVSQSKPDASARDDLEGYTAVEQIYEGAETFVYRAQIAENGTPVILKQTKNDYPSAREIARLRREFMILRELALDNTPRALALEEHGRGVRLVMADIGYPPLREIIEANRLDIETILVLAISTVETLAAIHDKRVIHKDISPRNILVDQATSRVFLIDFGISARLSREINAPTGAKSLEGTPLYVSPEQTGRMNRAIDARSDLYSLGVILYEMLVGDVPFQADEVEEVVQAHLVRTATTPRELVPSIPVPLSDIVMKLLAKTPEERYQSDAGLAFDLSECLRRWRAQGSIDAFPLCTKDKAPVLRRAQRLYGRERDITALLQAFKRARSGGAELVFVSGYPGIGKSALVRELRQLSQQGAYFISGKFDQLARDVPFAPVFNALRDLMREILTESAEAVSKWKQALLLALKGNGALLTEHIPELAHIIGETPKVPELTPDQAKNRFELTLLDFFHVFTNPTRPLVLFLDDLQWLDPASRRFLHLLLTDAFSKHLLVIGAYRDNEVEGGHPLPSLLAETEKSGFHSIEVHLEPLEREMVRNLIADTLTSRADEVQDLSDLVYEKTRGNPFFTHQFLVTLNDRDLLRFDRSAGAWSWNIDAIRKANVTDNVVDLLVDDMKQLPAATQHVLMLAACIGHSFDYASLVVIAERSPNEVASALWDAMKAGPIVSLDADYRYLEGDRENTPPIGSVEVFDVRYQFVHDRVHQAAYSLLPEERRQMLHLEIGRLLWHHAQGEPRDDQLLDLVHHLNIGASCMDNPAEKFDLAKLNLRAAERARASTAYHAANAYTRAGIALLREQDWSENFELCRSMFLVAGRCAYLSGEPEVAEARFSDLMARVKTDIERAEIHQEQVYSLISQGRFEEAIKVGLDALALLGHPLPIADIRSPQVMMAEIANIKTNLRGRRIADVIDAPEATDPVIRAVLAILDSIADTAHHLGPVAFSVINLRAMNIGLVHGNTELVALPYACVGYMLAAIRGNVIEGMAFCKLAEAINARFPSAIQAARLAFVLGSCAHMQNPMRYAGQLFATARQRCIETGELHVLGVGCFLGTMANLFAGDQLEEVLELAGKNLAIMRRTKIARNNATMAVVRQAIACLAGKTRSATSFSDDAFDEDDFIRALKNGPPGSTNVHYGVLKTFVLLLHEKYEDAWEASEIAERVVQFGGGTIQPKLLPFFRSLLLRRLPAPSDPAAQTQRAELLERYGRDIATLAGFSPKSFAHLEALVDAEAARVQGDIGRAISLYERAIVLCIENKAPHFEALTNELYAKFLVKLGMITGARMYMKNAYRAYIHWGAITKAAALETESVNIWPTLRDQSSQSRSTSKSVSELGITLLGSTSIGNLRDAGLVVRAAQAIASETDITSVVNNLSKLVLENAGADRGTLVLVRDDQFVVVAKLADGQTEVDVANGESLDDTRGCAKSIIRYTARTQEDVVIDDTQRTPRFTDDPHIVREKPRSILSLPLLHQDRLSGVLYLENRAAPGVFNDARVELLTLLSSQAAIAIEIARLIETSHKANEEIARANERLEQEVARRTEELMSTNVRLEAELDLRRSVEEERETLQEKVISAQRARLAELSTPLLPIAREIVVMPLIGTMDNERAEQVLSVALEGAVQQGARVVILDVTGVKEVDTQVARMLVDVAAALRLLGAQTLLTGISPRMAQTLIALDVNLTSFVTMSTLQSGMEYAFRFVRGAVVSAKPKDLRKR